MKKVVFGVMTFLVLSFIVVSCKRDMTTVVSNDAEINLF